MNKEKQRRQILRFLRSRKNESVDSFCIYQWIERCHFHGWWELGMGLSSYIPPNSLNSEYQKRKDYLLVDCRNKLKEKYVQVKNPGGNRYFSIPKNFWDICEGIGIALRGKSDHWLRLELNGKKIIIIEDIRPAGCLFKFTGITKREILEWLNDNGLDHLSKNIRPLFESTQKQAWLRLSWSEASNVIPAWTSFASEYYKSERNTGAEKVKTKRDLLRKRFWMGLLERAREKSDLHKNISPSHYNWIGAGAGRRGLGFNYVVREHDTQVELYIDREDYKENKTIFDMLAKYKNNIEQTYSVFFEWERMEDKRACRIKIRIKNGGYKDEEKWQEIYEVTIDAMCELEKAIRSYISKLPTRLYGFGNNLEQQLTNTYVVYVNHPTNKAKVHSTTCATYINRKSDATENGYWADQFENTDEALTYARNTHKNIVELCSLCI